MSPDKDFLKNMQLFGSLDNDTERDAFSDAVQYGLVDDYFNEWTAYLFPVVDQVQPARTFRKYVEDQKWESKELKQFVLEHTKPQVIKELDAFVAEFNADVERMKKEKDSVKLKDFHRRAMETKRSIFRAKK